MDAAEQYDTRYGMARRNDQMEGYLMKEIRNPFYVRTTYSRPIIRYQLVAWSSIALFLVTCLQPRHWHYRYAVLTRMEVCSDVSSGVLALNASLLGKGFSKLRSSVDVF